MGIVLRWKIPISHRASCSLGEKAQNGANIPKTRGLKTQTTPRPGCTRAVISAFWM